MKNMNSLKSEEVKSIYLFITGGAGANKIHLIQTICLELTVTKTLRHPRMNPVLPTVLLIAPTGVTSININGTTNIITTLEIPIEASDNLPAKVSPKENTDKNVPSWPQVDYSR